MANRRRWMLIGVVLLAGCAPRSAPPVQTARPGIPDTARLAQFTVANVTSLGDMTQIAEALRAEEGVLDVGTSFQDAAVLVVFDPQRTDSARLAEAIARVADFEGTGGTPFTATLIEERSRPGATAAGP